MSVQFLNQAPSLFLNLSIQNHSNYQVVYASQLYGTFFAISAKLNVVDEKLASMDLILVNYKGLYNLGMLKKTRSSFEMVNGEAKLVLHLSAFRGKHGSNKVLTVNCGNVPLSQLNTMEVDRQLHSFYKGKGPLTDHLGDDYFDVEFYERDGVAIRPITRMDDEVAAPSGDGAIRPRLVQMCKQTVVNFMQ